MNTNASSDAPTATALTLYLQDQALTFPWGTEVVCGRGEESDVQVGPDHLEVSRRHCRFRPHDGVGWVVEDLGSAQGTWISGRAVTAQVVRHGERIHLGTGQPVELVVALVTPAAAPPYDRNTVQPATAAPGNVQPPPNRTPAGRKGRALAMSAVACFVAVMLIAGVLSAIAVGRDDVQFESAGEVGPDPFAPDVAEPAPDDIESSEIIEPASPEGAGLYGGSGENACNKQALIDFLAASPEQGSEFARVLGISSSEIEGYVNGLQAGYLAQDTRVTNHGYSDGRATPRQSELEALTAVMVDDQGIPRVRCSCGNPLLEGASEGSTPEEVRRIPPPPPPPGDSDDPTTDDPADEDEQDDPGDDLIDDGSVDSLPAPADLPAFGSACEYWPNAPSVPVGPTGGPNVGTNTHTSGVGVPEGWTITGHEAYGGCAPELSYQGEHSDETDPTQQLYLFLVGYGPDHPTADEALRLPQSAIAQDYWLSGDCAREVHPVQTATTGTVGYPLEYAIQETVIECERPGGQRENLVELRYGFTNGDVAWAGVNWYTDDGPYTGGNPLVSGEVDHVEAFRRLVSEDRAVLVELLESLPTGGFA